MVSTSGNECCLPSFLTCMLLPLNYYHEPVGPHAAGGLKPDMTVNDTHVCFVHVPATTSMPPVSPSLKPSATVIGRPTSGNQPITSNTRTEKSGIRHPTSGDQPVTSGTRTAESGMRQATPSTRPATSGTRPATPSPDTVFTGASGMGQPPKASGLPEAPAALAAGGVIVLEDLSFVPVLGPVVVGILTEISAWHVATIGWYLAVSDVAWAVPLAVVLVLVAIGVGVFIYKYKGSSTKFTKATDENADDGRVLQHNLKEAIERGTSIEPALDEYEKYIEKHPGLADVDDNLIQNAKEKIKSLQLEDAMSSSVEDTEISMEYVESSNAENRAETPGTNELAKSLISTE